MSSVVKWVAGLSLLLLAHAASARDLNILVLQENSPSECNMHEFPEANGIYQLDLNGDEALASRRFAWDECAESDVLLPLGQDLIKSGMANRISFMPVGMPGTTIDDWSAGKPAYEKLKVALDIANSRNIKFDYVFWQGGIVDSERSVSNYSEGINKVMRAIKLSAKAQKFIISRSITCLDLPNGPNVTDIWNPLANRFAGPKLADLGGEYYANRCAFNSLGNKKVAQLWVNAIVDAEVQGKSLQRETLLYYFKRKNRETSD
jgi:hypothetical protein